MKFRCYLKIAVSVMFFTGGVFAQLGLPQVEEVYGGRIQAIEAVALDGQTTRVYVATESANSIFYTDIDHSGTATPFDRFYALADADTNDGFGKNVSAIAADGASGWVFFLHNGNIYAASDMPGTIITLANNVFALKAHSGYLFYIKEAFGDLKLYFGTIDSSTGAFTPGAHSPVTIVSPFVFPPQLPEIRLAVSPVSDSLYVFVAGAPPQIYQSSAPFHALDVTTTFTILDTVNLGAVDHYRSFGIAPDGRLYIGGRTGQEPNHYKRIAWTDNSGAAWDTVRVPNPGTDGPNIAFAGNAANYNVLFGAAVGVNKGEHASDWRSSGWMGFETHPNDGPVACDPNNPDVIYLTTDQGIGASDDRGEHIFEINEGVEAVQVNDFDMNAAKTIGWTASKSGIRRVQNYASLSEEWSIMFPMGDGSPYYSIAMDQSDTTGNTAFAGNGRIYKTSNGGAHWDRTFDAQEPAHGFGFQSYVSCIKIHPDDSNVILAGINSPEAGVKGGIFYADDGGTVWNRINTTPYNTEVSDFEIVLNADSSTTIYVACEYVSDGTNSSYGVKAIHYEPVSETITFENDMIGKTGTTITNFGAYDLARNSAGDVFVAGTKGTSNEPRVYVKYADSTYWELLPTATLPAYGKAQALTIGIDPAGNETPFIAVGANIYYLDGNTWQLAFAYPVGMDINVLFWDDLLVGTGTGLYGHFFQNSTNLADPPTSAPSSFSLRQNYPNPFNPSTTITYEIPQTARVKLAVYNLLGQEVAVIAEGLRSAGMYSITWEAKNLPSGIYFYRMESFSPDYRFRRIEEVRKMILLR